MTTVPTHFTDAGGSKWVCAGWDKPGMERVYIKSFSSGKDWLYYDINNCQFVALRTFNAPGQQQEIEAGFLLACSIVSDTKDIVIHKEIVSRPDGQCGLDDQVFPKGRPGFGSHLDYLGDDYDNL